MIDTFAGVLGLEPRMRESESLVLPITPYPSGHLIDRDRTGADERYYLPRSPTRNPANGCLRTLRSYRAAGRAIDRPASLPRRP